MTKLHQLGSTGEPIDDIEDAEFEEVVEPGYVPPHGEAHRPPDYTIAEWWEELHSFKKLIAVGALLLVCLFIAGTIRGPGQPQLEIPKASSASEANGDEAATSDTTPPIPAEPEVAAAQQVASTPEFHLSDLHKGERYAQVRKLLMSAGYEPARYDAQDCSPYGTAPGEECYDRPEVAGCSGTGEGFCMTYWLRGDDALAVVVANGPQGTFDNVSAMPRAAVASSIALDGQHLGN